VTGCCECGDEPSGSCATELVSYAVANYSKRIFSTFLHALIPWKCMLEAARWGDVDAISHDILCSRIANRTLYLTTPNLTTSRVFTPVSIY
jgi:hypothetical protein